jgi:hypothetical protein
MRAFFCIPMIFLVTLVPNCGPDFPCETNPPDELPPALDYVHGFPTGVICGDFTITGYVQDETQTDDRPSGLRRLWLTLDSIEIESLEIRMGCPESYDFSFANVQLPEMGTLELHAEDCEGNSAVLRAALIVDVFDEDPPAITWVNPTEDEVLNGSSWIFEVTVASDNEDLDVCLEVDGIALGCDDTSPYKWIVDVLESGEHSAIAIAEDSCGYQGESEVTFFVQSIKEDK